MAGISQSDVRPCFVAGKPARFRKTLDVSDKFTGKTFAAVSLADGSAIEQAIRQAHAARDSLRQIPAYERAAALQHVAKQLHQRQDEFADIMCLEAGKPIRDSRTEVQRAIDTFTIAAGEAMRINGEELPLDISTRGKGYSALVKRLPIGVCSFITPFNFPLNLVAHKVAPAMAMGCPFVLKPAPQTPITALMLAEILTETDVPKESWSIVPCDVADAAPLVEDERISLLSFTGSAPVGWMLKQRAGKKKVVLELGGNAACIVDEGVDVNAIADRIIFGAFYQSGQSCISIQRLIVHRSSYTRLIERLIELAEGLKIGDPRDEHTFLGPLISEHDVKRIMDWIDEATRAGAGILCGGKKPAQHPERFLQATIVENVPADTKLNREEVFGPVMTVQPFDDFESACAIANDSRYGLQAGVFTNSIAHAQYAAERLEVGGVIINDVPSFRIDAMPYGGVKDSGLGREGVRYAMQEMSELRTIVTRTVR